MNIHEINRRIIAEAAKKALGADVSLAEDSQAQKTVLYLDKDQCAELAREITETGREFLELIDHVLSARVRQGMKREYGKTFAAVAEDIQPSLRLLLDQLAEPVTEEMDPLARSATKILAYHLWRWCLAHGNRNMTYDLQYNDGWVDFKLKNFGEGPEGTMTDAAQAYFDKTINDLKTDTGVEFEFRDMPEGMWILVHEPEIIT